MKSGVCRIFAGLLACSIFTFQTAAVVAQDSRPRTIMRVFWQDRDTARLSYADLVTTSKWNLNRGWVADFLQPEANTAALGPMQTLGERVLIAVNRNDGTSERILFDSGVFEEPHGNHFHWRYSRKPAVVSRSVAPVATTHVSISANKRFVVHQADGGFATTDPKQMKTASADPTAQSWQNYDVGGNSVVLAFIDQSRAIAASGNSEGPDAGRVDFVDLSRTGSQSITGSIRLPVGGIQDAEVVAGKVFYATPHGIWWHSSSSQPKADEIRQVVGTEEENADALQSDNLTPSLNWLIAAKGSGKDAALLLINAASATPKVIKLPIPSEDGLKLSHPRVVLSLGKRYAFLFQGRTSSDQTVQEMLTVVELDPNRDRSFSDARLRTSIPVGASKPDGEAGQHDICFDAYGRYAVLTEPGTGIVDVLSLSSLKIVAKFRVGGAPDRIVAVGAAEHFH